ncbi:unnamed protein product [Mycena citricolor]|uniref:Uncharacterized protein n=1 Tax=Mycena citricolor TaxID=2018698 RepID=A0AAD2HCC8_9AGAR|nr:unnamed protein product [Mycena citricolor]
MRESALAGQIFRAESGAGTCPENDTCPSLQASVLKPPKTALFGHQLRFIHFEVDFCGKIWESVNF